MLDAQELDERLLRDDRIAHREPSGFDLGRDALEALLRARDSFGRVEILRLHACLVGLSCGRELATSGALHVLGLGDELSRERLGLHDFALVRPADGLREHDRQREAEAEHRLIDLVVLREERQREVRNARTPEKVGLRREGARPSFERANLGRVDVGRDELRDGRERLELAFDRERRVGIETEARRERRERLLLVARLRRCALA